MNPDPTYYTSKFQWSAFTEADLLAGGSNGTNFGTGDKFVMGSPTVAMSTYDNDGGLSWGSWNSYTGKKQSSDSYGQDASVNGGRVGCKMYADQYHVLRGSDGKTYYLIEIAVEGHDAPGAGSDYFTFYGAVPPAGTSLTVINTCSSNGSYINYNCLGAGTTAPPNTPPYFTNVPSDGVFCVTENTKLVIDLNAADKEGNALTYSIAGGDDASKFTIDAGTGVLNFVTAPDYEAPGSKDGDNTYKLVVAVADGKGGVTHKELKVNVCDAPEPTDPPKCIVIEAEDMSRCGYTVKCASSASGNEYVSLTGYNGYIQTTFNGAAGKYDLTVRHYDQSGDGWIKIYVNGQLAKRIDLERDNNRWNESTLEDLNLQKGDVVKLVTWGVNCEYALIDKITLCPVPPELGGLEGRVFVDANKDGLDNAEAGVAGVTVILLNAAGVAVGSTTTNADGNYSFQNLQPGNYSVVFPTEVNGQVLTSQNVGGDDTIDSDASETTGQTGAYGVVAGATTSNVDAGVIDPGNAALEGRVFFDENDNAVDNAEPGVAGVLVELLDGAGNVIASTLTEADGSYRFDGLDAGDYSVRFPTEVDGRPLVAANQGSNDTVDSDASQTTGQTGTINLSIGELSSDNDAGIRDPHTASLGDFVFLDGNRNGLQDGGEGGVAGVTVTLYNAAGVAIATQVTTASGAYLFENLAAGTYSVGFSEPAGLNFTTANVGANDGVDSDANALTGRTGPITLEQGEHNRSVDAGLVRENRAPVANDDAAHTCATEAETVNVLANDSDPDRDTLTITAIDGQAITEGQTITASDGVKITLTGGQLVFDANGTPYADALVGTSNTGTYSYSVADGNGGTATADVDVTFCGDVNTVDTIGATLPTDVLFSISTLAAVPLIDAYSVTVLGTGDARLDGQIFTEAYCLLRDTDIVRGVSLTADGYAGTATSAAGSSLTAQALDHLDEITWLINQDFTTVNNGDGGTKNYTDAEIQGAIWQLTGSNAFVPGGAGTLANALELASLATAHDGYEAGEGDQFLFVIDPDVPNIFGHEQPFAIALDFDSFAQDCLC